METTPIAAGPLEAPVGKAPEGWDAEFLAKRLWRVARLAGVPIPERMTYEQVAEVAGTILGQVAGALEFRRAKAGWQPIESAPHDKRVMVWSGQEMYCAHWAQNPMTGDEAWIVAEWGTDGDQALVKPTHWQALPLPPNVLDHRLDASNACGQSGGSDGSAYPPSSGD